jgi:hypothetical protein
MVQKPTHHVPTPTASDHIVRESTSTEKLNFATNKTVSLDRWVAMWPTPTVFHALRGNHDEPVDVYLQRVQDHKDGKTKGKPGPSLGVAVRMWPTPTAGDSRSSGSRNTATSKAHSGISLTDAVRGDGGKGRSESHPGGLLSPTWVEWLMGYPTGWTDLDASETP